MFRIETVVGFVVAMTVSQFGYAADPSLADLLRPKSDPLEINNRLKAAGCYKSTAKDDAELKQECANLQKLIDQGSGKSADCSDLNGIKEKAQTAQKQFKNSCGGAGFPTKGDSDTNIACSEAIENCNNCVSDDSNDFSGGKCNKHVANETNIEGFDFNRMKKVATYCPSMGAKNAKDFDKRLEDAKKDKKEAEKKLGEAQKKAMEAGNKSLDDQAKAHDTRAKAEQKYDDDLAEAEKKYLDAKKQIAAEIVQIQQEIAQVDDQIRQLVLQKTDAEMEFNEAIKAIEMNCHKSASDTVAAYQKDRLSRPFNRGSFGNMLKQVGLSDRESWQRLAEKYYRYCLASKPTKASKSTAKARYDAALRKADSGLNSMNEKKLALAQKQMNKKNGVCDMNSPTTADPNAAEESDSCVAAKQALSDSQRAERKYNSEANKAAAEEGRAAQKAQNEKMGAQMELGQVSQQIADEDKRIRGLRRAHEIASEAEGKTNGDPKAQDRAMEKYDEWTTAAGKYVSCKSDCGSDTDCQRWKNVLQGTGKVNDSKVDPGVPPLADKDKPTPAPATERSMNDRVLNPDMNATK